MFANPYKAMLVCQFAFMLTCCGLPNIRGVIIEKPILTVRATSDLELTIGVKGNYPPDEYPNFSGIEIYIGDNNLANDIEKRILYISSRNLLPSFNAAANENFNVSVVLNETFAYRYTSLANNDDYSEANISTEKDKLLIKRFLPLETYYFRVKVVTRNLASASSLTVPVKIPLILKIDDLNISANPRFSSLSSITSAEIKEGFGNIGLNGNEGEIVFIDNSSLTLKINLLPSGATSPSVFDSPLEINSQGNLVFSGYEIFSSYPLRNEWNYSFILSGDENNRDDLKRNLRMHVRERTSSSISFTLAYYQNFTTDIETKEAIN